jgi:beta-phosphoglucomutase family hydrolase
MDNTKIGLIFDMDGTLVNNLSYHLEAFRIFYKKYNITHIDEKEFLNFCNGRTNEAVMRFIFGDDLTDEQTAELGEEKEAIYRDVYRPFLALADGLRPLLEQFHDAGIAIGVASSAIRTNIDFVLDGLDIRRYFSAIVDSSMVSHGKPDPECFIKCAALLKREPQNCIVFEDAISGVAAGKNAGSKVIAITSIMPRATLSAADLVIDSFTELSAEKVLLLLK